MLITSDRSVGEWAPSSATPSGHRDTRPPAPPQPHGRHPRRQLPPAAETALRTHQPETRTALTKNRGRGACSSCRHGVSSSCRLTATRRRNRELPRTSRGGQGPRLHMGRLTGVSPSALGARPRLRASRFVAGSVTRPWCPPRPGSQRLPSGGVCARGVRPIDPAHRFCQPAVAERPADPGSPRRHPDRGLASFAEPSGLDHGRDRRPR